MAALDTNMMPSQLNPLGAGGLTGITGPFNNYITPGETQGMTSALQKRRYHTQHRVDAHEDRALRIRNSTEKVAFLYQQRWQTRDVFPLRRVRNLVLSVDHFEALPTFFSVTPEQAVATMLTQSNSTQVVKLVRYSLQSRVTQGFLDEDLGQERYQALLGQFGTSMNETANAEFARALLTASDPQQTWLRRHGEMDLESIREYMRWDHFIFGALQKIPHNPLEKINGQILSMMKKYMGEADVVIMTEDLQHYAQIVPLRKTMYSQGGPEAVDRVNGVGKGVDSNTGGINTLIDPVKYLQGNRVFIHRSQVVEGQGEMDPFTRRRQIGELNFLENLVTDFARYRSYQRDIWVYSQDSDSMVPISMRKIIENCNLFKRNGALKNLGENDTSNLGVRQLSDAEYYPFAVKANSYRAIRYVGDLDQRHFSLNDLNNAAHTVMNAAYRDLPRMREDDALAVTRVLDECNKRKLGRGTNAGKVRWADMADFLIGDEPARDIMERFASRLSSVMPGSIFLDPANSLPSDEASSSGRTLYESLILANSVPIYRAADVDDATRDTEDAALLVLGQSLKQLVKPESRILAEIDEILQDGGMLEATKVDMIVNKLRENIDELQIGDITTMNALVEEMTASYMRDKAQAPADRQRGGVGDAEVAGYITAGAPVPRGYVLGYNTAVRAARDPGDDYVQSFEASDSDPEAPQEDYVQFGDFNREESSVAGTDEVLGELSQAQIGLRNIPFFGAVIGSALEEASNGGSYGMKSAGRRTAQLIGSSADRLTSNVERIGASQRDNQAFVANRAQQRGFISSARRRLGLTGLKPAQIKASIETFGVNMRDLANHGMSAFRKILAIVYMGMSFTRQTLLSFYDNDVVIPVTGLFVRPHITVQTRIIAKCASGGRAGFLYYANPNVTTSDSGMTKTHLINMTFWMRAHVHAPRNTCIIPDVFVHGYHGGMGITPYLKRSDYEPGNMRVGAPCAFYMMCSYDTTRHNTPNPLDISGHENYMYRIKGASTDYAPHYNTAIIYAAMFGFGTNISDLPLLREQHYNTYCYRGHQAEWDGVSGHTKIEPNTGHWGPRVYAGCAKVRIGQLYELETPSYAIGGRG